MDFAFGETIIVWRAPAGRDKYGDRSYVEDHEIRGVGVEYRNAWEPPTTLHTAVDNREATVYEVRLFLPIGSDVLASDLIELPGDDLKYRVIGRPERWHHPMTGWDAGVRVYLKRIEG